MEGRRFKDINARVTDVEFGNIWPCDIKYVWFLHRLKLQLFREELRGQMRAGWKICHCPQTNTHTHTCFTPPSSPSLSTILILILLVNDRSAVFLFHTFPVSLSVFFMHRHTSYPCQVRRLLWLPDQGGHLGDILMSPVCMHECELTP